VGRDSPDHGGPDSGRKFYLRRRLEKYPALRRWREEQIRKAEQQSGRSKDEPRWLGEDWEYTMLAAAHWWGYSVGLWWAAPLDEKATAVVHYLENNMREGYAGEQARKHTKDDDKFEPGAGWRSSFDHLRKSA